MRTQYYLKYIEYNIQGFCLDKDVNKLMKARQLLSRLISKRIKAQDKAFSKRFRAKINSLYK